MSFLYLTTKGWKTGRPHQIEIWFVEHKGSYYIVSEMRHRSHWVQNIKHEPKIQVRIGKLSFQGTGRILDPHKEHELSREVARLMKEKYGWGGIEGITVELTPS